MAKYAISKEFFPYNHLTPPINKVTIKLAKVILKVPSLIYKDKAVNTKRYEVETCDGYKIESFLISPKQLGDKAPCLIYIHGGAFVFPASKCHYRNALRYAKEVGCKVWFINYRLAPKYCFPTFFEDCYTATKYLYDNAERFGIDKTKIGIGGDSAGSTLSVGVCMMARDRKHPIKFSFQMLPYPFLDMRGVSRSNKKYVDTPMWNSKLSSKVAPLTKVDKSSPNYVYYSPVEAKDFDGLPPAYIEPAEFDCLHDDGIIYGQLLKGAGVSVVINETKGTIHGFDAKQNAPKSRKALSERIEFMKKHFE